MDKVQFIVTLLVALEQHDAILTAQIIRRIQEGDKTPSEYWIYAIKELESIEKYISSREIVRFNENDRFITVNDDGKIITFNHLASVLDLNVIAQMIVENGLGHHYFDCLLD